MTLSVDIQKNGVEKEKSIERGCQVDAPIFIDVDAHREKKKPAQISKKSRCVFVSNNIIRSCCVSIYSRKKRKRE